MDRLFRAAIAALMISPLLMCSSSFGTYCDAAQICEGGNDKDVAACKAELDTERDVGTAYGCSGEFSKLVECANTKSSCTSKRYNTEACKDLSTAYSTCKKAASAKGK
jgi:hypothetical protein